MGPGRGQKWGVGLTGVAACSVGGRASCRSTFSVSFCRCSSTS